MIGFGLQVLGVIFLVWMLWLSCYALREFVIGPWWWRRKFSRTADRLPDRERLP